MSKSWITPWGNAQTCEQVAPGIKSISTASHGGYKVNKEQNALIPELFRREDGWYEEDCEWSIVVYFLADTFFQPITHVTNLGEWQTLATNTLMHWFPHQWQEYNGIERQYSKECWYCQKGTCQYSQLVQKNPICTRKCDNCGEIIYRDTLDKDLGWQIKSDLSHYYCSPKCVQSLTAIS